VDLEEQYAVALGVLSIVLWAGGWLFARRIASAPPRVMRTIVPILFALTLGIFGTFVAIARHAIRG
jgi:drug/metabolite transporter (DMT)-like permease